MKFGWTPREMDALKLSEFWMYLSMLDDNAKRESGETKKYELLEDERYEER